MHNQLVDYSYIYKSLERKVLKQIGVQKFSPTEIPLSVCWQREMW